MSIASEDFDVVATGNKEAFTSRGFHEVPPNDEGDVLTVGTVRVDELSFFDAEPSLRAPGDTLDWELFSTVKLGAVGLFIGFHGNKSDEWFASLDEDVEVGVTVMSEGNAGDPTLSVAGDESFAKYEAKEEEFFDVSGLIVPDGVPEEATVPEATDAPAN